MSVDQKPSQPENDADPMIDALLAEFIARDADDRSQPPDLTNQILRRLKEEPPESEDRDPIIDTLLAEFLPSRKSRRKTPPDLTQPILAELSGPQAFHQTPRETATVQPAARTSGASKRRLLTAMAAIAVAILVMFVASQFGDDNDGNFIAKQPPPAENGQQTGETDGHPTQLASDDAAGRTTDPLATPATDVKPFPLVDENPKLVDNGTSGTDAVIMPDRLEPDTVPIDLVGNPNGPDILPNVQRPAPASLPIHQIARQNSELIQQYWRASDIEPTAATSDFEVASRLNKRLGLSLPTDAIADPETLHLVLQSSENTPQIAKQFLATASELPESGLQQYQDLIDDLTQTVALQSEPLDVKLTSLIAGTDPMSSRWYDALGHGSGRKQDVHHQMTRRLASLSMNADLRCIRCHDSEVGSSATQEDYMSMLSLVSNTVQRENNRWVVRQDKNKYIFYERPDKRQAAAPQRVSSKFLDDGSDAMSDYQLWSQSLVGSDMLANGIVNSLWKMVHGRPLVASASDNLAAPVAPQLLQLRQQLTDDLKASHFDLTRTLALIIASPMSNRSVPDALSIESIRMASSEDRQTAFSQVSAFAAAFQTAESKRAQRIELAMQQMGMPLETVGQGSILAQPVLIKPTKKPPRPSARQNRQNQASAELQGPTLKDMLLLDFPGDHAELPASWLSDIQDYDEQVRHLGYMQGLTTLPSDVEKLSKQLNKQLPAEPALHQLWWVLEK